jgi:hypothetical protein
VALLMPAVQAARESGRRAQCQNNLKNLAQACQNHLAAQGHFPTGGWGPAWAGDPDRGFSRRQPGGWLFNLLPYIEQDALREMGKDQPDAQKRALGAQRAGQSIPVFGCPSRRRPPQYPFSASPAFVNINPPPVVAWTDFAANGGDIRVDGIEPGPDRIYNTDSEIDSRVDSIGAAATGVIFVRSECKPVHIRDGLSNTYLAGEKYLRATAYNNANERGNDRGWDAGYDFTVQRWGHLDYPPLQDNPNDEGSRNFGSPHSGRWHAAFADGSVHAISYGIDPEVHRRLSNRADRLPVNLGDL